MGGHADALAHSITRVHPHANTLLGGVSYTYLYFHAHFGSAIYTYQYSHTHLHSSAHVCTYVLADTRRARTLRPYANTDAYSNLLRKLAINERPFHFKSCLEWYLLNKWGKMGVLQAALLAATPLPPDSLRRYLE